MFGVRLNSFVLPLKTYKVCADSFKRGAVMEISRKRKSQNFNQETWHYEVSGNLIENYKLHT